MIVTFLHAPVIENRPKAKPFKKPIRQEGCYRNPFGVIKAIPMTRIYFAPNWVVEFSRN